ncbi:uncharacterized protein [Branchiostoma lanceolatum]|uniref:Hypp5201 protein n=1 Tax=Branchiostoma lanceolatum TaxID=7740 RepID=A0A8K0AD79_BRALA|nr:Hypp5201 [Branchiostoma lanceolatum]
MERFNHILKGNGSLEAPLARQRYFLTTADTADLNYSIPPWHGWGMGRPTKLYKCQDLLKKAEEKYGKEGFLDKLLQKEQREKKRQLNYEKKEKEQQARESKKQKLVSACPEWGRQQLTDSASVGALAQKCSMEQLQQVLVLAAEKSPPVIAALNAVKEEGLLTKKNFKELHPKLAKYFASDINADEALKRSAEKHAQAEACKARQTELNSGIGGEWELSVTSTHPKVKGLKGELKIDDVSMLDDYHDYIDFGDGIYFGGLDGFKGKSCVEDKYMQFVTKWKFCGRRVTGLLRVTVGEDGNGKQFVEGSFKAGAQERNWPVTLQFTGNRKGELDDDEDDDDSEGDEDDHEGLCAFLTDLEEAG